MGMDIPHIHWAIHLSPPSYLEDYLQEVGRIGRGEDERKGAGLQQLLAILLHSTSDFDTNLSNIQRSRIAQPQITEMWNAIIENHFSIPAGCLCIVPENGFKAVESPAMSARSA
jgi:superfamily II DNA helicase RecQ